MNEDRFTELVTKELTGEITANEQKELNLFLDNEDYSKKYRIYKMYWSESNSEYIGSASLFQRVKSAIASEDGAGMDEQERPLRRIWMTGWWRSAVAIIVVALCSFFLYRYQAGLRPTENGLWETRLTMRGSKTSFILPDGTKVSLNSASNLRFVRGLSGSTREVYLSGEAFFDVKKDAAHPFIIHAGTMNIRVLGTAFNVKAYPDETISETTLIRGAVEVTLNNRPADRIILRPTEKLVIDRSDKVHETKKRKEESKGQASREGDIVTRITSLHKVDSVVIETSWTQNRLIFRDADFDDVARSMERWYDKDIHIERSELKGLKFSANFEKETVEEALKALKMTEPFNYRITGRDIYIY